MDYKDKIIELDLFDIIERIPKSDWNIFKNKTVLITGATGTIAQYLVKSLCKVSQLYNLNIRVIVTARNIQKMNKLFSGLDLGDNILFFEWDVIDELKISENVDFIIHAAGNASQYAMVNDPIEIIMTNSIGTLNVANFAQKNNVEHVHFLSTREVYGDVLGNVIEEDNLGVLNHLDPRAAYPESKKFAENVLSSFGYQYGLKSSISRIAHAFGPGMSLENDGRVMADMIFNAVNNQNIVLKSDGLAERAFIYISDVIAGIFHIIIYGKYGEAYNLANESEPISIRDTAMLIANISGTGIGVEYQIPKEQSMGYSKIKRKKLSTKKLEMLGWQPKVTLRSGIKRTLESFKGYYD